MFAKGQRDDLDDDEATQLAQQIRQALHQEVELLKSHEGEVSMDALFPEGRHGPKSKL